jgi:hypothetical protein
MASAAASPPAKAEALPNDPFQNGFDVEAGRSPTDPAETDM